jgi:DinB family protein
MSRREELAAREAEAWEALLARLDRGHVAYGWSVAATVGHIAFWTDRTASILEAIDRGNESELQCVDVDEENARLMPAWESTPIEEARAALERARARIVAAWSGMKAIDENVEERFAGDSFEHYEEHTA